MYAFYADFVMVMLYFCLGVTVLVVGAMVYTEVTTKPFVSHKGKKWQQMQQQLNQQG